MDKLCETVIWQLSEAKMCFQYHAFVQFLALTWTAKQPVTTLRRCCFRNSCLWWKAALLRDTSQCVLALILRAKPTRYDYQQKRLKKKKIPRSFFSLVACNIPHLPPRRPVVAKINLSGLMCLSISLHFLPKAFSDSIYAGGQPPFG